MTELPGDPAALAKEAADYHRMSISLQNAATDLGDLTSGQVHISKAVDMLGDRAKDVSFDTNNLFTRYDGLASALATYSKKLQLAKDRAHRAIVAYNRYDVAAYDAQHLDRHLEDEGKEPSADPAVIATQRRLAQDDLRDAVQARDAAESEWASALAERDAAAQEAIDAIKNARARSGVDDTYIDDLKGAWDKAYNWAKTHLAPILKDLKELAKIIGDIVGPIALILSVLAFALSWVPVLGQVLAAVAAVANAIVLIAAVLVILSSLLLTVLGKQSIGEFLKDALKFAASLILKKAGGMLADKVAVGAGNALLDTGSRLLTAEILTKSAREVTEGAVDTAGDVIEPYADQALDAGGEGSGLDSLYVPDLAFTPEAETADWNAPPIPDIAPVVIPDAPGAGWLGENVVDAAVSDATSLAESRPQPAIPVSAGGGGSW